MRRIASADRGKLQTVCVGQRAAIDRIVLEHDERVEQFAQSGKPLDLGKTQMLVRDQPRLAVLDLPQQIGQRLLRRQRHPQRQGVDEQPHHALDAGDLRRAARHRHAEHHVVAAAHAAEQNRPGGLQHGVERHALPARLQAERRAQRLVHGKRDLLGYRRRPRPVARRQMGRFFKPRQGLPAKPLWRRRDPAPQAMTDSCDTASAAAALPYRRHSHKA